MALSLNNRIPRQSPIINLHSTTPTPPLQQAPHTLIAPLPNDLLHSFLPPSLRPLPSKHLSNPIQIPLPHPIPPQLFPFIQYPPRCHTLRRVNTDESHSVTWPLEVFKISNLEGGKKVCVHTRIAGICSSIKRWRLKSWDIIVIWEGQLPASRRK